ncbi:hypothetical protein B9Q17_07495 [Marinobacter vinifirmus]|uniref:Helix-turn-helix domain-containing protein n=1 Tax=Marinobacter vinifirmus TaxID=355591 RepID=A0A7Z1IL37_9GAMM|nr:hypothetical protein [Marinobacter vinifirmus]OZC35051.1 hypothetical protein B9Q17_07495 [Marinobacter vinifirmus]
MSVIRRAQGQEFTVLPNRTIRDPRLSLDALGLLVKLISRPPNWEVRPYQLQQECAIGRDKLRRLLAELESSGYLVRIKSRRSDGTWDWVSEVYQETQTRTGNTTDGNPGHGATMDVFSVDGSAVDGSPVAGKPGDIKNTDPEKIDSKKQREFTRRDLVVTDEMRTWAVENAPLVDLQWETQVFQTHPRGVDQRYRSQEALQAAWRTWVIRGQQFAERDRTPHKTVSPVDTLSDTSWAEGGW